MAERRMFAKAIVESDAFLEMPHGAQVLYLHLGMNADDDGFVNRVQTIMRMVRAGADDLNILVARRFVILFDTKVLVVKHWRINNYIQKDRYRPTDYQEEFSRLILNKNGAYSLPEPAENSGGNDGCIQPVYRLDTQIRLGKVRLDESSSERASECVHTDATTTASITSKNISADNAYTRDMTTTTTPSIEDVRDFAEKNGIVTDLDAFYAYNEMRGWDVKNWRGALKRWAQKDAEKATVSVISKPTSNNDIPLSSSASFSRAEAFDILNRDSKFKTLDAKVRRLELDEAHAEIAGEDGSKIAKEKEKAKKSRANRACELGFNPALLWED